MIQSGNTKGVCVVFGEAVLIRVVDEPMIATIEGKGVTTNLLCYDWPVKTFKLAATLHSVGFPKLS